MAGQSVIEEQRARVAAYANSLADIAAVQTHGLHVFVAGCLSALARLRVADHIDGEAGIGEVATRAGVHESALRRILRFLESQGFVELRDDRASLTGKGRLLRSDSPCGLALCGANDAAGHLAHSLRTGEAAFPRPMGEERLSEVGS